VNDVPPSCLNYNQTSKQYTEAKTVVEQAKKSSSVGHLRVAFTMYEVIAVGLLASFLLK